MTDYLLIIMTMDLFIIRTSLSHKTVVKKKFKKRDCVFLLLRTSEPMNDQRGTEDLSRIPLAFMSPKKGLARPYSTRPLRDKKPLYFCHVKNLIVVVVVQTTHCCWLMLPQGIDSINCIFIGLISSFLECIFRTMHPIS